MTLQSFLGEWLYWPLVVAAIGFTAVSIVSNVSMIYTEIYDQAKEVLRVIRK